MENIKSEKVLTAKELASYFDHTLLRANATVSEFKKLCDDSKRYGFCMVAINPAPVKLCKTFFSGQPGSCRSCNSFSTWTDNFGR